MFLQGLSPDARAGFAALAHALVHADGRLAAEEAAILDRVRAEAGAFEGGHLDVEAALACIGDPAQRRAAFLELIGICWSDGMIADEEAVLLDRVADGWAIEGAERAAAIDWVKRQSALIDDARALIGAES